MSKIARTHLLLAALVMAALSLALPPAQALPPDPPAQAGSAPYVALTFDDGPSAEYTPQVLDILKQNGVHATFFVIGKNVEKHPEIAARIVAEGHEIGNHSYSHPLLTPLEDKKQLGTEIKRAEDAIFKATGVRTVLFRPPHGWESPWMVADCERMGYYVVNWTVDPKDWKHPSAKVIVKRILPKSGKGVIVLLHDGLECRDEPHQQNTVAALPQIIADFRDRGYRFITITDIISDTSYAKDFRAAARVIARPKRNYY